MVQDVGTDEGFDLTTKGQIHTHDSSGQAGLNVGSNTQVLTADSTTATGLKWSDSAGGDVSPNEVVMSYNTTIGDYTTNAGVTQSSGTVADTYTTDFASSTGWTNQGSNTISGGALNFQSTDGDQSYYDFTSIPQGYFRLRLKLNITYGSCSCNASMGFGVTNTIPTNMNSGNVYGYFWSGHRHNSGGIDTDLLEANNQTIYGAGAGSGNADGSGAGTSTGTYYMELEKDGTTLTITHYTDGTYTTASGTANVTVSADNGQTMRYFIITSRWNNASISGSIDDFAYNKGLCANAVDDNASTQCQTDAGANQWLKADYGSLVNFGGLAIYKGSANTETQWKLQASTDDSAWTDLRTQNTSDYSGSGYDYVRFNVINARYIRVYGNSGSSAVVALNEIKSLQYTDAQIVTGHGHLGISSSDTSLGMNGT